MYLPTPSMLPDKLFLTVLFGVCISCKDVNFEGDFPYFFEEQSLNRDEVGEIALFLYIIES